MATKRPTPHRSRQAATRTAAKTSRRKKRTAKKKSRNRFFKPLMLLIAVSLLALVAYTLYLNRVVTQKFEGKKWALPAQIYARPLELYQGQLINPDELQAQLRRQGYQPVETIQRPGTFRRQGNRFDIYSRGFQFPDGPEYANAVTVIFDGNEVVRLIDTDTDNQPVALLRLDPQPIGGIYPATFEDRILIRLSLAPKPLVNGLLNIEDREFYNHAGISPTSIARAFLVNFKEGALVQGGSTLTQQLVKNFYLSNERTLTRKINEAIMSLLLDFHYSKEEILETYLNEVYLGQTGRRAIHGFGLASHFYFAQPIQELNLAKVALLIALVKGPSYYDPRRYPERALERRNLVLTSMADSGIIPKAEAERSSALPLGVVTREQLNTSAYPAYVDVVKKQLRKDYKESDLTSEGLRIFTNMDPIIQRQAQSSMTRTLDDLQPNRPELQGAMVVTAAQTGDLLAIVGDRKPGYIGFNRALDARRPVGSLLKPAIFLTALEQPSLYSLTTPLNDAPIQIDSGEGNSWQPTNYDNRSRGWVPLQEALIKSYNQAAVKLGMEVGLDQVITNLKRLGIETKLPRYPSVLLGSASLSPIEIAGMYQTLASGGFRMPIRAIDAVVDAQGRPLKQYNISVQKEYDAASMALMHFVMGKVMREGTGRRAYRTVDSSIQLAGKSGTTDGYRDSWFAGFSSNIMTIAWVGNDDNEPTNLTGSSGALTAWSRFMAAIPLQSLQASSSDRIEYLWVNPLTDARTDQECEGAQRIPYIRGHGPKNHQRCNRPVEEGSPSILDSFRSLFQ